MADEDVEMDNFSEDRAESASDFAGDDENEKVAGPFYHPSKKMCLSGELLFK